MCPIQFPPKADSCCRFVTSEGKELTENMFCANTDREANLDAGRVECANTF